MIEVENNATCMDLWKIITANGGITMRKSDLPCEEILRLRRSGMTYRAIGEKYGISKQFVERICRSEERRERFERGGK